MDQSRETLHKKLSLYVAFISLGLIVLSALAAFALALGWSAFLEPAQDGEKVLEILRQKGSPD